MAAGGTSGVKNGPAAKQGTADAKAANAAKADRKSPALKSVLILGVPHVRQKPDFCGEACAEMFLQKLGKPIDQDEVFNRSGLDPALGRGCDTAELAKALEQIGFAIGPVWQAVDLKRPSELESQFRALHADLAAGVPSIVCMHYSDEPATTEHFRLLLGYDATADEVIYHEPAEQDGAYRRMKRSLFLKLWPLASKPESQTVIRMRLEPERIADVRPSSGFSNADYAQHILRLKKRLPGEGFTIVLCRPFVVVGDEPAESVKLHAEQTVRWAVEQLKQTYFDKDPEHILDIWLFKDEKSYNAHATKLFGEKPGTPYGYYSAAHRALVMNISTGGGTLVHEIVHPFMAANFPACPSWFNEGLASLYEQCGTSDGKIHGYTNWRLPALQRTIKAGRLPSFETLTGTTTDEFYHGDPGSNYGQARYLCYYLQDRDLLQKYYKQFVANHADDPTGYKTLQSVLAEKDMRAFRTAWEAYVLKLKFR